MSQSPNKLQKNPYKLALPAVCMDAVQASIVIQW